MNTFLRLSFSTGRNRFSFLIAFLLLISVHSFTQNISAYVTRDSLYKAIKSLAKQDSGYIRKADSAKKLTDDLIVYIAKVNEDLKQTSQMNASYQVTTVYFFSPYNGTATIATDLKKKIVDYKKQMLALPDSVNVDEKKIGLSTADVFSVTENKIVTWEHNYFYDMPVAAAVSLLSSLQSQVYDSEEIVLRALLKELLHK